MLQVTCTMSDFTIIQKIIVNIKYGYLFFSIYNCYKKFIAENKKILKIDKKNYIFLIYDNLFYPLIKVTKQT